MTTPATQERRRFADLLAELGPDEPTLCGEWNTRDLAAHIVIRDRRPDAMPGIVNSRLAGYTAKVQAHQTESDDYATLVGKVRDGAPIWSPTRLDKIDRLVNTAEFYVHLEDVRRAQPEWTARDLDDDLVDDLYGALKRGGKMMARKAPAGVTLEPDGGRARIVANDGEPMVVVTGPVGELVLWLYGRQAHALVTYDGPADSVESLRTASFGI